MFHVKHRLFNEFEFHKILFFVFLFLLPIQTRILFGADQAYIFEYFSYHQAFFLYLSDIVLIVLLADWLIFGSKKIDKTGLFIKILAYISLIFITLFHVKHLDLGLYHALKWVELLGLLLYCSWNLNLKDVKISLAMLFIAGILQAGIGIAQFHVQHSLNLGFLGEYIAPQGTPGLSSIEVDGIKHIRAYGTMPHPNVLAGFLVSSLISGLFYVSSFFAKATEDRRETSALSHPRESGDPKNGSRIPDRSRGHVKSGMVMALVSCGTIIILLGIFFSFSRVGWIAAALVIFGFIAFHVKQKEWSKVMVIVMVTLVSCGTILVVGYKDLALARGTESFSDQSITLRGDFDLMGLEIIKKYPALGVGVGNYIEALKDLYKLSPWQHQPPHNIYIFLAAELGILGLGLFLIILFEIVKSVWHKKTELLTFTLLTTIFVFLLIGLFDHYFLTIQQGRLIFFTALGLLATASNSES